MGDEQLALKASLHISVLFNRGSAEPLGSAKHVVGFHEF